MSDYRLNQRVFIDEMEKFGAVIGQSWSMGVPLYRVRLDDGGEVRCMGHHLLPAVRQRALLKLVCINGNRIDQPQMGVSHDGVA